MKKWPITETDKICAAVRAEANKWTPEYRAEMFRKGMAIVEMGTKRPKKKAK